MLDGPSSYSLRISFWAFCVKINCSIHCCPCGQICHDDTGACCLCRHYIQTVGEYFDSTTTTTAPPTTTTTTTTAAPTTTASSSSGGGGCFPGVANVHLENGNLIKMSELRTGDLVQTGL